MAGILAEAPLDRRHGPESRQDLARRDARDKLAGQVRGGHAAAVQESVEGFGVDFGVLADLERGEMEAERLEPASGIPGSLRRRRAAAHPRRGQA